jgi:hypothetical protein
VDATLDILEVCLAKAKVPKARKGFVRKNCPSSGIGAGGAGNTVSGEGTLSSASGTRSRLTESLSNETTILGLSGFSRLARSN